MEEQRFLLEMGFGADQDTQNYTKAAQRAVDDATGRVALPMFTNLGLETKAMRVLVTIGVDQPDQIDAQEITVHLQCGKAEIRIVHGGLTVENSEAEQTIVTASAAVEAFMAPQLCQQRTTRGRSTSV